MHATKNIHPALSRLATTAALSTGKGKEAIWPCILPRKVRDSAQRPFSKHAIRLLYTGSVGYFHISVTDSSSGIDTHPSGRTAQSQL